MFKTYNNAIQYLYDQLKPKHLNFGNERLNFLLQKINNPQNSFQTIHISGTSGKGSTAYITSKILKAHGYKTGLHLSPHILDIRERFQINNKFPTKIKIINIMNKIIPIIEECKNHFFGSPTFFEITLILAYLIFQEQNIDIAIIETGCGGLLDGTNTCNPKNKICVITDQGYDHQKILGNNIKEIIFQIAGIIKKNNTIITNQNNIDISRQIIDFYKEKYNGELIYLTKNKKYKKNIINSKGTSFKYKINNKRIDFETNLLGEFQIRNISLAIKTCEIFLKQKNEKLNIKNTKDILRNLNITGRFEKFTINNKTIIIDGAHNEQKINSFTKSLTEIYPRQKFHFLIAIKGNKEYKKILKQITTLANQITTTEFIINKNFSLKTLGEETYKKYFDNKNFKDRTHKNNPQKTLEEIINSEEKEIIVITGSLYLLSFIYPTLKNIKKQSRK